ncbi:uncharacterized protein LOC144450708 isoform X2 [Glandiceps talaboti]
MGFNQGNGYTTMRQGSLPDLREAAEFVVDHETKEIEDLRDEMLHLHFKPAYTSPRSAWSAGSSRQELERLRLQTPQTPNVSQGKPQTPMTPSVSQSKPQTPLTNGEVNHNIIKPTPPQNPKNGLKITGRTLPLPPKVQQNGTKSSKTPSPTQRGKSPGSKSEQVNGY